MGKYKYRIVIVFLFLIVSFNISCGNARKIDRFAAGLKLGMSLDEARMTYDVVYMEASAVDEFRETQMPELAERQIQEDKARQVEYVRFIGIYPKGISEIKGIFYKDNLFWITLKYDNKHTTTLGPVVFLQPFIEKYGKFNFSNDINRKLDKETQFKIISEKHYIGATLASYKVSISYSDRAMTRNVYGSEEKF